MRVSKILALSLAVATAVPALGQDRVHAADQQVDATQAKLAKAVQSGDAVSIAVARSRAEAARATAWGYRHPGKQPVVTVATKR